MQTVYNKVVE